jgi:uncharacterized protein YtpQ (UPF0354 family)
MDPLDSLFGPRDKEQFARLVIDRLKQAGETGPIVYDSGNFALTLDDDETCTFELANVYAQYRSLPEDKQNELLQRVVDAWFGHDLPGHFKDLHPHLLPALRSRAMYEFAKLQARIGGNQSTPPVYQIVAEHLGLGLVYEWPSSMQYLTQNHLERWGVSFDEALGSARENLARRRRPTRFRTSAKVPGIFVSNEDDGCDASRLIFTHAIRGLRARGDPVAMVPNEHLLVVAGTEDVTALKAMAELTPDAMNRPPALSGIAVRLDGDQWVPWMPKAHRPHFQAFHALRLQTLRMYSHIEDSSDGREYDDEYRFRCLNPQCPRNAWTPVRKCAAPSAQTAVWSLATSTSVDGNSSNKLDARDDNKSLPMPGQEILTVRQATEE